MRSQLTCARHCLSQPSCSCLPCLHSRLILPACPHLLTPAAVLGCIPCIFATCSWVARDMSGATFSDWYPYLREGTSQALMRSNHPFRVFSCWNGGVVVPAAYILNDGITFRTWRSGEVRSLHPNADKSEVRGRTTRGVFSTAGRRRPGEPPWIN